MAIHNYVNGECFTLKILCPEISKVFLNEQRRLNNYLLKTVSVDKIHIGLKYMAYESDYSDEYMKNLIPEIKKIVTQNLPIKIEINELGAFWDAPEWPTKPIIFLKVKLTDELKDFHNKLRILLNCKVDTFLLAEGDNYTPHITLGVGDETKIDEIKEMIAKSRFSKPISFVASKFAMRLKGGATHLIN